MFALATVLGIILILILWIYWKLYNQYNFWKIRGVPGPEPKYLIGNTSEMVQKNRAEIDLEWSRKYGKMYGYFMGTKPQLVITEAELIKQIMVKDFHHFANRQKLNAYHEMWNNNLLNSEDEQWRRIRTIATPAFTSGKLRSMHKLMSRCVDKLVHYLDQVIDNKGGVIQDTKDVMAGFTIDVIASTSFATETNANDDRAGAQNPIVQHGKDFFNVKPLRAIAAFTLPRFVLKLLGIKTFFSPRPFQFFVDLTSEIVRQRKLAEYKRHDLVQLLIDAYVDEAELESDDYAKLSIDADNETHEAILPISPPISPPANRRTLTEQEIIAQCILFFAGGFETTASTIFHAIYELAKNGDIQDRLECVVREATDGLDQHSEQYFDQVVNHCEYLEATIKETLRMYPPIAVLFRRVSTDGYKLAGVSLPKDLNLEVSPYAVHHNPEYYPEPEQFNPNRFMPENKDSLIPYTYLPFGTGPRNCVGMRFAYQEVKLCLASIILRYRFSPTRDTPVKPVFVKGLPLLVTETFPIKISKRQN